MTGSGSWLVLGLKLAAAGRHPVEGDRPIAGKRVVSLRPKQKQWKMW